ncbi:MAG: ABC transporter substrate-binding protein [Spirochaetia bacterium]|jgi:putative ABC transport system substrate-binding protein|nr:ABC transporter substrate-binding protein [Spirochaetia bacterium]
MRKQFKSFLMTATLAALVVAPAFSNGTTEQTANASTTKTYKIGVSKIIAHPALDADEKGLQDYLATTGLDVTYNFQVANGEVSTAAAIAQQFKAEGCDITVGIGTPSAQALANVFHDKPVVFSAITDPKGAGLVADNLCGVSDANPVEAQISLLVKVTGAKTIGNIYTSSEANGVVLNQEAQAACDKLGLKLVSAAVTNSSEAMMAAQSIMPRVDAVYIATDNAVISALASIADVCTKAGKPLFSADASGIDGLDFLIAWGFNYYNIGRKTGELIEKCIKGAKPGDIGSVMLTDPADFKLVLNLDNAKTLGITFPDDVLASAAVTVENGKMIEKK